MPIEIPKDKWPGSVRAVTIGATNADGGTRAKSITVGGQTALPYMHFEAPMPNKPVVAVEIKSRKPEDWSALLMNAWGDAMTSPAASISYKHIVRHLAAKDESELKDLGLAAERKSPVEVFLERKNEARKKAGLK